MKAEKGANDATAHTFVIRCGALCHYVVTYSSGGRCALCAIFSAPATRLRLSPAVPSRDTRASAGSGKRSSRRCSVRRDRRQCRKRCCNWRRGRCCRRRGASRHGSRFRRLLLKTIAGFDNQPAREAPGVEQLPRGSDENQSRARSAGVLHYSMCPARRPSTTNRSAGDVRCWASATYAYDHADSADGRSHLGPVARTTRYP